MTSISADDNLTTRHNGVKASLDLIRTKKQKILDALKKISEEETPDKALMGKLVDAFDSLSDQEKQYTEILQNILLIHERATNDVANDLSKKAEDGVVDEDEGTDVEGTLKELGAVSGQALAASLLNEQLLERLDLHKKKRNRVDELVKERSSTLQEDARAALEQVELARLRVASEQAGNERKKKQLEQLRKEALRRGIQLRDHEEEEREEERRRREEAEKKRRPKQEKRLLEGEKAVPEELAPLDRIPGIAAGEEQREEEEEEQRPGESREETRRRIREERDRREQLTAQIRQRLAAIEARKKRVEAIRQMLTAPPSDEQETPSSVVDIEATLASATANLHHLTTMRERLEAMREAGEQLPDDQAAAIERLERANGVEATEGEEERSQDEVLREVRSEFERALSVRDVDRLARIEHKLDEQWRVLRRVEDLLAHLLAQHSPTSPATAAPTSPPPPRNP